MDQQKRQIRARFETLVREQHDMLLAYLRAQTGQTEAADDLFQKTMLEAWSIFEKFDPDRPAGPWLRGIARNLINSQRRDDARRWRRLERLAARRLDHHFDFIEDNPDLEFDEVIDGLMECLEQLTPNYRSPLQHCYWDDLPVKEIAAKVGVALETCKKRLQRARKMLRDCMTSKGMLAPAEGYET